MITKLFDYSTSWLYNTHIVNKQEPFVKYIIILLLTSVLFGCAEYRPYAKYYRPGDPCIRCGETFQQIPNFEYEAIVRKNRGEEW